MSFNNVGLYSYRNIKDLNLDVSAARVFLIGENGQGKTNFLEALYYLCYGSSFRGSVDANIPRAGETGFGLRASWNKEGPLAGKNLPHSDFEEISVKVSGKTKEIRLNNKVAKDRKELVEHNPAVVFCHEDFGFAIGEPEKRRFFFDQCSGMISLSYIDMLRSFRKVLKQRNAVLRDIAAGDKIFRENSSGLLDALDSQLAFYGVGLMEQRRALAKKFGEIFPKLFENVSRLGREIALEYRPSWPIEMGVDGVRRLLESKRESEIVFGTTRSGPHRDVWRFMDENEDFADKASTGQLRLVSLVMRLAQIFIYEENSRNYSTDSSRSNWPILLLDDVLLELDVPKRMRFLELLPGSSSGAQAFFTFLPEEPWTEYVDGTTFVYGVKDGRFESKAGV